MRATQSMMMLSKSRRRTNSVLLASFSICSVLVMMQEVLLSRQIHETYDLDHGKSTTPTAASEAGSGTLWNSLRHGDLDRSSSIRSVYINKAAISLSPLKTRTGSGSEQQSDTMSLSLPSNSSNSSTTSRPTLVIHIGPPKTGSTFLQCSLCGGGSGGVGAHPRHHGGNQLIDVLSQQDSYVFLGTCPWRMCHLPHEPSEEQYLPHRFDAFLTTNLGYAKLIGPKLYDWSEYNATKPRRSVLKPSFFRKLAVLRQQGNVNGLVIFEGLSKFEPFIIQKLSSVLIQQQEWNVQIVVAYRPLYEWLPSKYNSITKVSKNPRARYWPNHATLCNSSSSQKHCQRIEPFDLENRGKFSDYVQYLEQHQLHPSHMIYQNFAQAFDQVQLVPLHQLDAHGLGDPLLEHFFCHILTNAPHTCRHIRAGDYRDITVRNPSDLITHEYDRLVVEAYAQGLYQGSLSRAVLRQWALEYQHHPDGLHRKLDDFPRTCVSESTLDRLERLSWKLEQNFFFHNNATTETQAAAAQQREELHNKGFRQVVEAQRTFCSMDVNRTLQAPKWQSFFASPYCVKTNATRGDAC